MSFHKFLETNPLSIASVANIFFSCSVGCLFFLSYAKVLSLIRSNSFIFVFISINLKVSSEKDTATIYVRECSPYVFH